MKPYVVSIGGLDHTILLDESEASGRTDVRPVEAVKPDRPASPKSSKG